jgi:hypothetical protein
VTSPRGPRALIQIVRFPTTVRYSGVSVIMVAAQGGTPAGTGAAAGAVPRVTPPETPIAGTPRLASTMNVASAPVSAFAASTGRPIRVAVADEVRQLPHGRAPAYGVVVHDDPHLGHVVGHTGAGAVVGVGVGGAGAGAEPTAWDGWLLPRARWGGRLKGRQNGASERAVSARGRLGKIRR